eukprot:TRINITY_DN12370_c0_g1_i1.p1 TRINITY_DN12370_c0_g1~~TRINITY_DN12370_c0_g1_i1.p1  ORF type:complete len:122 (-),score=14.01 TRINITY_DN12370_c0_g1_i1:14-349(-)
MTLGRPFCSNTVVIEDYRVKSITIEPPTPWIIIILTVLAFLILIAGSIVGGIILPQLYESLGFINLYVGIGVGSVLFFVMIVCTANMCSTRIKEMELGGNHEDLEYLINTN